MLDATAGPSSGATLALALVRLTLVRRRLAQGRLHELLNAARAAKSHLYADDRKAPDALDRLAVTFEQTARLTRSHDQCLARSIALARLALARNLQVDLLIGVRLNPFAAHAWVQSGARLVDDRVDTVRTYTPILAV